MISKINVFDLFLSAALYLPAFTVEITWSYDENWHYGFTGSGEKYPV
jgi:hypothetical protein